MWFVASNSPPKPFVEVDTSHPCGNYMMMYKHKHCIIYATSNTLVRNKSFGPTMDSSTKHTSWCVITFASKSILSQGWKMHIGKHKKHWGGTLEGNFSFIISFLFVEYISSCHWDPYFVGIYLDNSLLLYNRYSRTLTREYFSLLNFSLRYWLNFVT